MEKMWNVCFSKNLKLCGPCGNIQMTENFQNNENSENFVFLIDFRIRCPAWLVEIKKSWKHSSRLVSFAKVGEIQDFSLSIRPLSPAFWPMLINEKNNVQSNNALTAIWEFYKFLSLYCDIALTQML